MRQIAILQSHNQSFINLQGKQTIVLGVHSFLNCLMRQNKQQLSILLEGSEASLINNVLWNQFYSTTLIKDCHRFLAFDGNSDSTFLRLNGKVFKLLDHLSFDKSKKIRLLMEKCKHFTVEGFSLDGIVKSIDFQFENVRSGEFDVAFSYAGESTFRQKTVKQQNKRISVTKSTSKSILKSSNASSALKKTPYKPKNLSQNKKENKFSSQNIKNLTATKKRNQFQNKIQINSLFNSDMAKSISDINVKAKPKENRQNIMGTILMKKEQKCNELRKQAEQISMMHQKRLQDLVKSHNEEIQNIKAEINEVLAKYKKKNKELKKQKECLIEINSQLTMNLEKKSNQNKQLQAQKDELKMRLQEKSQQNVVLNNELGSNKLDLQKLSRKLIDNEEEIQGKNSKYLSLKQKYEILLKNVKIMGTEMHSLGIREEMKI